MAFQVSQLIVTGSSDADIKVTGEKFENIVVPKRENQFTPVEQVAQELTPKEPVSVRYNMDAEDIIAQSFDSKSSSYLEDILAHRRE